MVEKIDTVIDSTAGARSRITEGIFTIFPKTNWLEEQAAWSSNAFLAETAYGRAVSILQLASSIAFIIYSYSTLLFLVTIQFLNGASPGLPLISTPNFSFI